MLERIEASSTLILLLLAAISGGLGGCAVTAHQFLSQGQGGRVQMRASWLFAYAIIGAVFGLLFAVYGTLFVEVQEYTDVVGPSLIAGIIGAATLGGVNVTTRLMLKKLGVEVVVTIKRDGEKMQIKEIYIHCSATGPDLDIGAAEIRQWHTDPKPYGNGWADIGYHYVIRRDGSVEKGRDESVPGAHVLGHNKSSLGVCLVGGVDQNGKPDCNFTRSQWGSLAALMLNITQRHPQAIVRGHRDADSGKDCPTFDAAAWWSQ